MKTGVHKFLCCMLAILSVSQIQSQDIHFSQFFEAPLLRNPALAGLFTGDLRLQAVYRTQWQSVTVPYQTVSINGEYKLSVGNSEDFLTVGGQILYDKAGSIAFTSTHILPTINYHKSLSEEKNMYLSLGFMGGLVQRRFDRSKVTTDNQFNGTTYDPTLSDGENFSRTGYSYFDGTTGISFNSQIGENQDNNYFIGVSYHHFNKPKDLTFYNAGSNELTPKWVYSGGLRMSTNEFSYITLHGDYSQQGSNTEIIGGLMYSRKLDDPDEPKYLLHLGAMVRVNDAIIPVAKLEMKPIAISVSYDANTSKLAAATRGAGGFEVGIAYQDFTKRDNTSRDAVRCPRF